MPKSTDDRRLGALLGAACGDALGTTLEFTRPRPTPWAPLLDGPHREIIGGGPFYLAAGQITDDTQMACCLASSLADTGGTFDPHDVASRYREWMRHAFDIGGQTQDALARFASTGDPGSSGIAVWTQGGCRAAGNGSLMRCTPIALTVDRERQRDAAIRDSLITHADPRCVLACARYIAAIDAGISGADPQAMLAAAQDEGKPAAAALLDFMPEHAKAIDEATADLDQDLQLAAADDPDLYGTIDMVGAASGFVRVAFRLEFWELLHAPDYRAGVVDAVNRGGDADTNGAIVGGLLGARYGAAQIPARWREAVLNCEPKKPWNGPYHPRVLLTAFEALHHEPQQP